MASGFYQRGVHKNVILLFLIICIGGVIVAGCTSTGSTGTPTPEMTAPTLPPHVVNVTVTTMPIATITVPLTTTLVTIQPNPTIDTTNYAPAPDAPNVWANFHPYLYLASNGLWTQLEIPNCSMEQLMPEVVNTPDYGISPVHSNISSISTDQFQEILNEWDNGENQNFTIIGADHCSGAPPAPYWTFVEVSAYITPRNFKPVNYEIVEVYQGFGKTLGTFTTTQNLSTNNPYVQIDRYIPVRSDQASWITNIPVQFYKLNG